MNFFRFSVAPLACFSARSRPVQGPLLGAHHEKIRPANFPLLTSSWQMFKLSVFTPLYLAVNCQKRVVSSLPPGVGGRNIRSLHICVIDLRTSSFPESFSTTTRALAWPFGNCQLIYLSIYFFNFNFLWSVQLRHTCSRHVTGIIVSFMFHTFFVFAHSKKNALFFYIYDIFTKERLFVSKDIIKLWITELLSAFVSFMLIDFFSLKNVLSFMGLT